MTEPDRTVELDERGRMYFEAWAEAKSAAEAWAERRDNLADKLLGLVVGDALDASYRVTIDGLYVVTAYAPKATTRFDQARFHQAMPDLYNDFLVPSNRKGFLRLPPARRGT